MTALNRRTCSIAVVLALIVMLLAVAAGPALAVEPWAFFPYTPSPTAQSLTAGCAVDANNIWAGGGLSTVVRYNGSAWATESIPIAGIFVGGMAAANATNIWAVGDNLDIFYSDGTAGGNWVTQNSAGTGNFYGAYALDQNNVWAVGGTTAGPFTSRIYKWNGTAWADETPAGINDQFKAASGCDADHVWAAGYDSSNNSHIYFRDATHTWNATAQYTLTGVRLRGIKAIAPNNVWAVGNGGTILHFNGTTWAPHSQSGVVTTSEQYMVNATSAGNVWSAGSGNSILNFDGTTWTLFNSPDVTANHRTALPASTGSVWVTGQGGKIFNGAIMRIASANPTWGAQTQTLDVDIVGTATHFVNGTSAATFSGTGITVNSTTVTGDTLATANITIAAGAAPGARDVNVTTGAETPNVLTDGFNVRAMHTITTNAGANGTITPAGPVKVLDGDDQAFTITPAAGYHTTDVAIDGGVHLGAVTSYKFENVKADHTISASFSNAYSTWYLAEGSTAWGFGAGINIANPNDEDLNAKVTYMLTGGKTKELTVGLPKTSKVTVMPAETVGNADFSTKVECVQGKTIAVDRTMEWQSGEGQTAGAHNSIGVTAPSTAWYLPEGSSKWGFQTWLLIQNPGDVEASCDVTYMIEGVGPKTINHQVPEHSRATYNLAEEVGQADASIKVDSNVGVIPERAMYTFWPASGSGDAVRREGHDSIGALQPANDFFLAEGSTAWGFTTYVLVQNPNSSQAKVTLTYMTNDGPVTDAPFTMPANSRKTIRVNDAHPDMDLSTKVHSDKPIVAERSMFWSLPGVGGLATTDSIGTSAAHMSWCLPDGAATDENGGAETFTLVQNPNKADVQVRISYLNEGGKDNVVFTDTVPASSRKTYNMADKYAPGATASASIVVESLTAGKKVIVERSMYMNGRWGGTDTIGAWTD